MSLDATLQRLETTPLLGSGWDQVATGLFKLRGHLQDEGKDTVLRVILLDAGLRSASPAEDPVPFLASAERWARGQELELGAIQLCLQWCQHVGRVDPGAVPDAVRAQAVAGAQADGTLEAEWRLALSVGHPDDIRLLTEALAHLDAPHHAHSRLQVRMDLAAAHLQGGDVPAAVDHLLAAQAIADTHDADLPSLRIASMLGQLRLVQGLPDRARPHLQRALSLAQELGDDLALLTQASLLAGVQLGAGEWTEASATAALQIPAAQRRSAWLAVADGTISQSTCALKQDDATSAVALLVQRSRQMRGQAPIAAMHLLQARLAELRVWLGDVVFDPLLAAALTAPD